MNQSGWLDLNQHALPRSRSRRNSRLSHALMSSIKAPSGSRTRTSAMARQQAAATSWVQRIGPNCQRSRAPGGTRTHVAALRVRGPRRWTTSAYLSVGSEGLEPSPTWLRTRHAAANTLIPSFVFFRSVPAVLVQEHLARRESNPRSDPYKRPALTVELRPARRLGDRRFDEWGRRESNPYHSA